MDVIIVGGGMVGAALACALSQQSFRVALVELHEPVEDWPVDSYDQRVSAITRASKNIFQHLGAWSGMQERRVTPYAEMKVWDYGGFGQIHFDAAEIGEPELGHIIENRIIQRALWDRLAGLDGVQIHTSVAVASISLAEDSAEVHLENGESIRGTMIVAADGARSRLREMAGIKVKGWAYDQTAVVATLRTERGNAATAWQRFMPAGPLALLPIEQDLVSIVWSTSPEQAAILLEAGEDEFARQVTDASEQVVGEMELLGQPGAFPLRLQHATSYIAPGFALVGDAAHVIHPLAGQGVNLGLLDAAVLVEVLAEARAAGIPIGGHSVLRRYERSRRGDNIAMQAAMDGFKRLFSNSIGPVRLIRNIGLGVTDSLGPVKRLLVRNAMGITGDLPRLARPMV